MNRSETLAETMVITSNFPHRTPRSASRRLVAIVAATATALGLLAGAAIPARADNLRTPDGPAESVFLRFRPPDRRRRNKPRWSKRACC